MTLNLNTIMCMDALTWLKTLPDESVHCVVTSPPYYGLRDYGTATWLGGDPDCEHRVGNRVADTRNPNVPTNGMRPGADAWTCQVCGATRQDAQIGLEASVSAYIDALVTVFREVRRVLRSDGTLWLNLGDSYAGGKGQSGSQGAEHQKERNKNQRSLNKGYQTLGGKQETKPTDDRAMLRSEGLKPKDLMLIPHRVAIALQMDGWWVRMDNVWSKPNPMPESVTDRPTKSHEYMFLLTQSADYWYDADAIKEPSHTKAGVSWDDRKLMAAGKNKGISWRKDVSVAYASTLGDGEYRNKRSVWEVSTKPFSGAHFATFPPDLIEPCILAGCPQTVCAVCGAGYERVTERERVYDHVTTADGKTKIGPYAAQSGNGAGTHDIRHGAYSNVITLGWQPTCECNAGTAAGIVLDMFMGAGTTALVARMHGRNYVGCELNPEYVAIAQDRLRLPFEKPRTAKETDVSDLPLFAADRATS